MAKKSVLSKKVEQQKQKAMSLGIQEIAAKAVVSATKTHLDESVVRRLLKDIDLYHPEFFTEVFPAKLEGTDEQAQESLDKLTAGLEHMDSEKSSGADYRSYITGLVTDIQTV